MTTEPFQVWMRAAQPRIDDGLEAALQRPTVASAPAVLRDAMGHALLGGGKRIRPSLCMLACEAAGGREEAALPAAVAVEMIHAYSLVHDDLPCMDDDALRRGLPSVHAAFGEATAVLAGDALQSLAFELLGAQQDAELARDQVVILARAAGAVGMVGGQVLDMQAEGEPVDEDCVRAIHGAKTGALFRAAVQLGVRAGGGGGEAWQDYSEAVGRLFQATDDLLDASRTTEELGKTAGKDDAVGKATLVAALGLDGARASAKADAAAATEALERATPLARYDELAGLPGLLLGRCR